MWKRAASLAFNALLFFLVWALYQPHQGAWRKAADWGNASPQVRAAVLDQLRVFQDGYTKRDVAGADEFMGRLFSHERPLVLGTMPGEIYVGYDRAREVIRTDWESWGDCRFRLGETQVSAEGDVAWFATIGSVTFDLSRFLGTAAAPLRRDGQRERGVDNPPGAVPVRPRSEPAARPHRRPAGVAGRERGVAARGSRPPLPGAMRLVGHPASTDRAERMTGHHDIQTTTRLHLPVPAAGSSGR